MSTYRELYDRATAHEELGETSAAANLYERAEARRTEVAERLAALDADVWHMNASAFTCTEADAIADFLREWSDDATAALFLRCHAEGDDQGDAHFAARGMCVACGLRDATPGRDDGLCSECAAGQGV